MRNYANWLYALVIVLITCALIWFNVCLRQERSRLMEEKAQLIEKIEQIDIEIAKILRQREEIRKRYELEQEVFDDIIDSSTKY